MTKLFNFTSLPNISKGVKPLRYTEQHRCLRATNTRIVASRVAGSCSRMYWSLQMLQKNWAFNICADFGQGTTQTFFKMGQVLYWTSA